MAKLTEKDVLIRNVAYIVRRKKGDMVAMLNNAGVKMPISASEKTIWDATFLNIGNPKVKDGVANLLNKHTKGNVYYTPTSSFSSLTAAEQYAKDNAAGINSAQSDAKKEAFDWKGFLSKGLEATKSVLDIFKGANPPEMPPVTTQDDDNDSNSSNTWLYVGIGIAVLAIASVTIYFATKKK